MPNWGEVRLLIERRAAIFGRQVIRISRKAARAICVTIRYTPPGTSVDLSLEQPSIAGQLKALVRVRDHGLGVPDKMLSDIFVPFYRVQEQTQSDAQGAGLGLAIAERVIRMHDGSIRARNAEDGGLIVEMELPLGAALAGQ